MSATRFGLVGFGLFGQHHARAIDKLPECELAAIAVPSESSRNAAAEQFPNAKIYTSLTEMLAAERLDVVDVVAPNVNHFDLGMEVLQAGRHLFIEKPMCTEDKQLSALLECAEAEGKLIGVNHELRVSSLWGGVKQLVNDGAIGKPRHALIELSRFPYRPGSDGWRYDINRVGNWILEEPIHFFDLARWYLEPCGDPTAVYARASARDADRPELQDNFTATVSFADGAYAVVSQTLAAFEHHVTAKITGEKGCIWAYWSAPDARSDEIRFGLRYGLGDSIQEVTFEKTTGELLELADNIQAMASAIANGTQPPCTGVDGRWSAHLCLAAQRSVDSGQVITLKDH